MAEDLNKQLALLKQLKQWKIEQTLEQIEQWAQSSLIEPNKYTQSSLQPFSLGPLQQVKDIQQFPKVQSDTLKVPKTPNKTKDKQKEPSSKKRSASREHKKRSSSRRSSKDHKRRSASRERRDYERKRSLSRDRKRSQSRDRKRSPKRSPRRAKRPSHERRHHSHSRDRVYRQYSSSRSRYRESYDRNYRRSRDRKAQRSRSRSKRREYYDSRERKERNKIKREKEFVKEKIKEKKKRGRSEDSRSRSLSSANEETQQRIKQNLITSEQLKFLQDTGSTEFNISYVLEQSTMNTGQDSQAVWSLLSLQPEQLQSLVSIAQTPSYIYEQILVRELWIGNLSRECDYKKIKKSMETYGKIETVDYFPKANQQSFAFVKYEKVAEATKAFCNTQSIVSQLGNGIKIHYSDHLRRFNIVGDLVSAAEDRELTTVVYIGFYREDELDEEQLKCICCRYGATRNFVLRKPEQSSQKNYLLVEYLDVDTARTVVKKIKSKHILFPKKVADVSILIKSQLIRDLYQEVMNSQPQNLQPNVFGHQNSFHNNYQQKMMPHGRNPYNNQFGPNPKFNYHQQQNQGAPSQMLDVQNHPHYKMNNYQPKPFNPQFQTFPPKNQQQQIFTTNAIPPQIHPQNFQKPGFGKQIQYPPQQQQQQQPSQLHQNMPQQNFVSQQHHQQSNPQNIITQPLNQPINQQSSQPLHQPDNNSILEKLKELISASEPAPTTNQASNQKETHDDQVFWSGFLTRQKQFKVGVDIRLVSQQKPIYLDDHCLNVSHRTTLDDALKYSQSAVGVLFPSDASNAQMFDEYVHYFIEKQRAGVIQTNSQTMYVLPPCESAFRVHKITPQEMLVIFSDNTINTQQQPYEIGMYMKPEQQEAISSSNFLKTMEDLKNNSNTVFKHFVSSLANKN